MAEDELRVRAGAGGATVSLTAVETLIGRVQQLVDSGCDPHDALAWHVTAAYLADLPAIASLASLAARAAEEQR